MEATKIAAECPAQVFKAIPHHLARAICENILYPDAAGPVAKCSFQANARNFHIKKVSENRQSGGSRWLFLWPIFSKAYFAADPNKIRV